MENTSVTDEKNESVSEPAVKIEAYTEPDESGNEKEESDEKKVDSKKVKNPDNSDESDDENKIEKNNLEQSFDLSSDEEDEDEDQDEEQKDLNNINEDAGYLDDLMAAKQVENEDKAKTLEKSDKEQDKTTEASTVQAATSADAKVKSEAQKKKTQGTDNSSKELARKKKLEQMEEENKRMQVLMANFSEEQLNRYEVFRRSAFQKSTVKKIIQTVGGKTVSASVVIAMSGIAKVFIGEITEKALDIKSKWGDTGPLQPKHLREAYRLMKNESKITTSLRTKNPSLF